MFAHRARAYYPPPFKCQEKRESRGNSEGRGKREGRRGTFSRAASFYITGKLESKRHTTPLRARTLVSMLKRPHKVSRKHCRGPYTRGVRFIIGSRFSLSRMTQGGKREGRFLSLGFMEIDFWNLLRSCW